MELYRLTRTCFIPGPDYRTELEHPLQFTNFEVACAACDEWAATFGHTVLEGGHTPCGLFLYCVDQLA